jgi:tetratricopeptide (TPR) repeat protein
VAVEAYDAYLKGKHTLNRRPEGLAESPARFEHALALEPSFAAAHAGLGESHLWLGIFAVPPSAAFVRVRRHAERALVLDPELADAHWLLAQAAYWHDWDAEACERHVGRALDLEPRHAGALMTRGHLQNTRGRPEDALEWGAAAVRADPLGLGTRTWFLAMAYNAHAYELLIAEATRLIASSPRTARGTAGGPSGTS